MPRRCPECGGARFDFDTGAGHTFCLQCGVVTEENAIISEVTFGETASGAAVVTGVHVGSGSTGVRMGGPHGRLGTSDSGDAAKAKARDTLRVLRMNLGLGENIAQLASRWFTLCVEHKFTKGREHKLVVAACLYVAARQESKPIMLIDLSSLIQQNVFDLGMVYLKMVQTLKIRKIPLVDPAFYIDRFSKLLEFGEDREKIAKEAVRIVQRFTRDWLHTGRRPSGICGAALILAARMHNYRRSILEVVQIVKIADTTLKKRLEEFKATPSANLTLEEFRNTWLEQEENPPAFTRGLPQDESDSGKENKKRGKKRKRAVEDNGDNSVARKGSQTPSQLPLSVQPNDGAPSRSQSVENNMASTGLSAETTFEHILSQMAEHAPAIQGASATEPLFLPELNTPTSEHQIHAEEGIDGFDAELAHGDASVHVDVPISQYEDMDAFIDQSIEKEVQDRLGTNAEEFEDYNHERADDLEVERQQERDKQLELRLQRVGNTEQLDLTGLDDNEMEMYLLTDEEVEARTRIWVEMNRDWLEKVAAQEAVSQGELSPPKKKARKFKSRNSTMPRGATPAESAVLMLQAKMAPRAKSKKIDYDALNRAMKTLLGEDEPGEAVLRDDGVVVDLGTDKDLAGKEDDEEDDVIEEEGGDYMRKMPARMEMPDDDYTYGDDSYLDEGGWEEEV